MKTLTVAIYGLFGTLAVAAGVVTLVAPGVIIADSDMSGCCSQ